MTGRARLGFIGIVRTISITRSGVEMHYPLVELDSRALQAVKPADIAASDDAAPVREYHYGRAGLCDWQFKRVTAYLAARIDSTVRVSDLAAVARMSPGHFARAFTIRLGMSPYTFVLKTRFERARRMLLTSDKPLSEIALHCGLADQAHLSRVFRRFEGASPSEWRRQRRAMLHAIVHTPILA